MRGRASAGSWRALAAVVVAAALLGTAGTAAALGPDALAPEAAAAWRTVIGGVGLVAGAALWGRPPWRYPLHRRFVVVGGLGVAVNQLAFFAGIERAGVAVGTLVTIGAVPVAAGILDWWGSGTPRPPMGLRGGGRRGRRGAPHGFRHRIRLRFRSR